MGDEAFDAAEGFGEREKFEAAHETAHGIFTPGELEGNERAETVLLLARNCMAGLNGVRMPTPIENFLGAMIAVFLFVVWAFPNAYEWLRAYPTALDAKVQQSRSLWRFTSSFIWQPRVATGLIVGVIGALTLLRSLSGAPTEFVYAQF